MVANYHLLFQACASRINKKGTRAVTPANPTSMCRERICFKTQPAGKFSKSLFDNTENISFKNYYF